MAFSFARPSSKSLPFESTPRALVEYAVRRGLVTMMALGLVGCAVTSRTPRFPWEWTEASMCDSRRPLLLTVVNDEGRPLANANVWTDARLHEGGSGFGEIQSRDVFKRGPVARTAVDGRVRVCDVTTALVEE